jgi:protein-disulfide isomerase
MTGMTSDLGSAPVPALRDDDHVMGDASGRLVVVYGDFACPRCAVAWSRMRDAPIRLVFRHFALKAKHPRALALAHAAEAAASQDAFWAFADALWSDQGHLDDPHLWARAQSLGLDLDRFERDRRSPSTAGRVQRDVRAGLKAGITTTPTLVLDDALHPGPPSRDVVLGWTEFG